LFKIAQTHLFDLMRFLEISTTDLDLLLSLFHKKATTTNNNSQLQVVAISSIAA